MPNLTSIDMIMFGGYELRFKPIRIREILQVVTNSALCGRVNNLTPHVADYIEEDD